jgi:hypothetical protein
MTDISMQWKIRRGSMAERIEQQQTNLILRESPRDSAIGTAQGLRSRTRRQGSVERLFRDPIECRHVVHDHPPFVAARCQRRQPSM